MTDALEDFPVQSPIEPSVPEPLAAARALLKPWTLDVTMPDPERVDVRLSRTHLVAAVRAIMDAGWGYLSAITGLDLPSSEGRQWERLADVSDDDTATRTPSVGALEALYHFCVGPQVLTLRVMVPVDDPVLPSVCPVIPSATLYERELIEMFGFQIPDTPDASRLLVADDWPEGVYPLRKEFDPGKAV